MLRNGHVRFGGRPAETHQFKDWQGAAGRPYTYVRIPSGFCYTAFITDVCTRRIVGWAVAASLHTEALPMQALEHALLSTQAEASNSGLVHHSDRGSQAVFNRCSQQLTVELSVADPRRLQQVSSIRGFREAGYSSRWLSQRSPRHSTVRGRCLSGSTAAAAH